MRRAAIPGLLVSALFLGCHRAEPARGPDDDQPPAALHQPPPPNPPFGGPPKGDAKPTTPREEPRHEAEKGGVPVGDVTVTVQGVLHSKFKDSPVDVVIIGIRLDCSATAKSRVIKGFASNDDLIRRLTGKNAGGESSLPIELTAKTDVGDECRLIMRTLKRLDTGEETEVSVQEMKAVPGAAYRWVMTFERPGPNAKRILLDLPAADFGGTGTVRFSVPAGPAWKLGG